MGNFKTDRWGHPGGSKGKPQPGVSKPSPAPFKKGGYVRKRRRRSRRRRGKK